ncbi:hypothetical protein EPO17_00505 [Patescibacteria group bacterium]|nr:MAG: hypothetical protein EPO17_00505 [Patescibacteria group bacterium]
MGIRVITHNGKHPDDGGLRIGYLADDGTRGKVWIPIANPPSLAAIIAMPAYVPPKPQVLALATVRNHRTSAGLCNSCWDHVIPADGQTVETDWGRKMIYTCPGCKAQLRSFDDRWLGH